MSGIDGKPCKRGHNERDKYGRCVVCKRESRHKYVTANPEKEAERKRQYKATNPEKVREDARRYRAANTEKSRESVRQYAAANPDKVKAIKHARRTRKTQAGGSYTAAEWKALVAHQNGSCLACGKEAPLTADHIVPVSKGGSSNISNIQGLCLSCNSRKKDKVIDYRKGGGFFRWIQKKLF